LIHGYSTHRHNLLFTLRKSFMFMVLVPQRLTCGQDIIALVVQGVGGGMASSASDLAGANVVRYPCHIHQDGS
jgi:hypothetical protein